MEATAVKQFVNPGLTRRKAHLEKQLERNVNYAGDLFWARIFENTDQYDAEIERVDFVIGQIEAELELLRLIEAQS